MMAVASADGRYTYIGKWIANGMSGAFVGVCLVAALAGFSPSQYNIPTYKQSDKVLHFITFFLVTVCMLPINYAGVI